ncbi:M23 family metallopeptidase [Methylocapsa sp. S129]|uniref:M23 family metallopeptidase n=1 Tax=Methylocapsa sp. S129 TaxID=1641869 RepID=UPI00131B3967|nr:M23 family metallopeptidase [Methylocapsa sp. S129]
MAAQTAIAPRRPDRSHAFIDLGREQPIDSGVRRLQAQDRRAISIRWLVGAVLTGLCGVALIGSALYLGLDSQSNFAEAPEIAAPPRHEGAQEEGMNPGKGDRLVRPVDIIAAKQTFKAPTTIRIGDKEVVKARTFTHVATTLTLTPTGFADAVPEFNPLKLTAGAEQPDAAPDPGPVQDDAEVAFSTRDLTGADAASLTGDLTLAEAQAQVVESIHAAAVAGAKAPLPLPPQMLLMRTSRAGLDPSAPLAYATTGNVGANALFSSIEVRMVPENVTNAPRSRTSDGQSGSERLVLVRHGETIEDILRANGASKDAVGAIVAAFGAKKGDTLVTEGQKIILQYDEPAAAGQTGQIGRISLYSDEQLKATIAVNDAGAYVPVTMPAAPAKRKTTSNDDPDSGGMSLYQSFFETALKQGIPRPIIDEMVKAFANDVDFQRATAAGDSVDAFYSEPDDIDAHAELLYATVTAREQIFKYYRFETPDDGLVDYYDENGRSVRKFLIRKPIAAGELRSGFGMRYHPILHYARMHTGVDWSNAIGTPILAAGNGSIIKAEYTSGYGNHVEIQHANGYVTTYSHMSGFARGIAPGIRVTQGQVIGYLGQTGLATGPHLHYEVIVNGRFVDPMAIKLARTREFDGKMLAAFKRERDRIDGLLAQAPNATPTVQAKVN